MNHKSHGKSLSFKWLQAAPLQGRPTWKGQGAGTTENRVFQARIGDPPYSLPRVCSPGLRCPYPQHRCLTPSASRGCTWACLNKLVVTTLRKPDEPAAAGAGLLQEVSWWIYSLRGISNTPWRDRAPGKTGLGWPHLCNWWEQTTELPQQLGKMNTTCLPGRGGVDITHHPDHGWDRERDDSKYK